MVTMSQKSSFLQPANSVSQVLIPDSGAKRRKTMTKKPSKQIPRWLTIDVMIILVGLVIITGGIWITNARIFGMPI
jgi:hypothetical protein